MTRNINDLLDADTIQAIADQVWFALVGEDEYLVPLAQELGEDAVSSWVEVIGPWNGAVVVTCGAVTAEEFTRALLGDVAPPELEVEDLMDAFNELANVLGGNIKSVLPGPAALGLPQFGIGPQAPADPTDIVRVDVLWRGQPLSISVQGVAEATSGAPLSEVSL